MRTGPNPFYVPTHRRSVALPIDPSTGFVFADVQNDAACTCRPDVMDFCAPVCARHAADRYADMMARHATDSIGPVAR